MQTDHPTHLDRAHRHVEVEEPEAPISISYFTHVLQRYWGVVFLSLLSVALLYLILAIFAYLLSPSRRVVMQRFRLDFEGAGEGKYPNGTNFNVADIVGVPILVRVYNENKLSDYLRYGEFSRSMFVLESNKQYDDLAAEYQAKLSDPKLSSIDRERIEKEFELKRQSIVKNEYAVHLMQPMSTVRIPDVLARKILHDTLNGWADFVVNQQHATSYKVNMLTPAILQPSEIERRNPVAAIQALRSKANRVIANIETLKQLPSASHVRTTDDRLSLEEIRIRLEEIVRFRLEPLVSVARSADGVSDPGATRRFLENQLAFDQRQLEAATGLVEATQYAMAAYDEPSAGMNQAIRATKTVNEGEQQRAAGSADPVVPQLSDSFLDRLITLTGRASDIKYRQKLIEDYRKAAANTIPHQQAVAYDKQVIQETITATPAPRSDATQVQKEIDSIRAEVGRMIAKTNQLFQIINQNMTPSAQLFTVADPPVTRVLRSISPSRLALYGVLIGLLALPLIVAACLLHNRVQEEHAAEEMADHEANA